MTNSLNAKKIYKRDAWQGYLFSEAVYRFWIHLCIAILLVQAASTAIGDEYYIVNAKTSSTIWVLLLVLAWVLVRISAIIWKNVSLRKRSAQLGAIATAENCKFDSTKWVPFYVLEPEGTVHEPLLISMGDLYRNALKRHGYGGAYTQTIARISDNDWSYSEYRTTTYSSLSHYVLDLQHRSLSPLGNSFKSIPHKYLYSAVVEVQLPRELPNLYFDSFVSTQDKSKLFIDTAQKLTLEGDFDTYFTTYAPLQYPIDTLTLITPDVMLALIEAKDYNIEITNDKLYLYSDGIPANPQRYAVMVEAATRLRDKLSRNMATYRDDRVAYAEGRQTVSNEGRSLRRNLLLHKFTEAVFYGLLSICLTWIVVQTFTDDSGETDLTGLVALLFFTVAGYFLCIQSVVAFLSEKKQLSKWRNKA